MSYQLLYLFQFSYFKVYLRGIGYLSILNKLKLMLTNYIILKL